VVYGARAWRGERAGIKNWQAEAYHDTARTSRISGLRARADGGRMSQIRDAAQVTDIEGGAGEGALVPRGSPVLAR
jgi:hypothetical protein